MTRKPTFIIGELITLFIIIPLLLALEIHPLIKVGGVLTAIIYCVWIARKHQFISLKSLYQIDLKSHWKRLLITTIIVFISSYLFMIFWHPENLFIVVKQKPLMWLGILFVYAFLSVYPQELMYRSFFFKRYECLFKNQNYLLLINIIIFPLAHIFLMNWLVILVTLIGGIFFTLTYNRTKSVLLTSIEHAIYGNWLFTLGMGEMLAFPMPQ